MRWSKSMSLWLSIFVCWLVLCADAAALFFLPRIVAGYLAWTAGESASYTLLLAVLYTVAAVAALICGALLRLLYNIRRGDVFTDANVRLLRVISWCCYAVAALFGVLAFSHLFALLIAVAAAFFGLILRVVKNVVAEATEVKRENDFTV